VRFSFFHTCDLPDFAEIFAKLFANYFCIFAWGEIPVERGPGEFVSSWIF
jgi:hypothetical protein